MPYGTVRLKDNTQTQSQIMFLNLNMYLMEQKMYTVKMSNVIFRFCFLFSVSEHHHVAFCGAITKYIFISKYSICIHNHMLNSIWFIFMHSLNMYIRFKSIIIFAFFYKISFKWANQKMKFLKWWFFWGENIYYKWSVLRFIPIINLPMV